MRFLTCIVLFISGPLFSQSSLYHDWKENRVMTLDTSVPIISSDPLNAIADSVEYTVVELSHWQYEEMFNGNDFFECSNPYKYRTDFFNGGSCYVQSFDRILIPESQLPKFSVFCRMEALSYSQLNVMFSIHAGGFNEQDDMCH